jgi:hypothetical protein
MRTDDILQIPADTLLAEELASEDVVEMANLTTAQTGVPGTILISTAMGGHGPRVKYFLEPGARNRAFPSLSLTLRRSWPIVCLVSRNKDALLDGPSRTSTTSFRNFSSPPMHYRHPCEGGGQQGKRRTSGLWIPACAGMTRLADSSRQREPLCPLTPKNRRGSRRSSTSTPGAAASGHTKSPKSAA